MVQIGDLRITFWGSTASHVSAVARQRPNPEYNEFELVGVSDDENGTEKVGGYKGDTRMEVLVGTSNKHFSSSDTQNGWNVEDVLA